MIVPSMFYTKTDEAADLATNSLFRIFRAYLAAAGVDLRLTDISVANRVLAQFQEYLTDDQRALFSDDFGLLGRLTEELSCKHHQGAKCKRRPAAAEENNQGTSNCGLCQFLIILMNRHATKKPRLNAGMSWCVEVLSIPC